MERTLLNNHNLILKKGRSDSPNSGLSNDIKYIKFDPFLAEIFRFKVRYEIFGPTGKTITMLSKTLKLAKKFKT